MKSPVAQDLCLRSCCSFMVVVDIREQWVKYCNLSFFKMLMQVKA